MARRHIAFEIKMLREMACALGGGPVSQKALRNALLETFLIHYRNLYDFFFPDYPRRKRLKDDVYASDYLPRPREWRDHRPEWLEHYAEHRSRMNTQLAHLSYKRLRYETRSWPDQKMAHRIEKAVQDFIALLPEQRRAWFRAVAQEKRHDENLPVEGTPALTAQATLDLSRAGAPRQRRARVMDPELARSGGRRMTRAA